MSLLQKISIWSAIIGLIAAIIGSILGFKVLPDMIENEIKKNVVLQIPDQYIRWKVAPYPLDFKIHFFEVTNFLDIFSGKKPVVKDVGPIVFKKSTRKENINFNEDTKTYDYNLVSNFVLDTDNLALINKNITVFNAAGYGLLQYFEKHDSSALFDKQAHLAFGNLQNLLFHEINIGDFLVNGYRFCKTMPESELCSKIRLQSKKFPHFRLDEDNSIVFSVFNKTRLELPDGMYNVDSGITDVKSTGQIYKYKGNDYLEVWNGTKSICNKIKGTDSTIFQPFCEKETVLFVFNPDICRSVALEFNEEIEYKNIPGYRTIIRPNTLASADNFPDNECFCIQETRPLFGEKCFPDGFTDLQNCLQFPFVGSFPHLLWADESYQNTVDGLFPDMNKHAIYLDIEPDTGTPLRGASRIQFNMMLRSFGNIPFLNKIKPAVIPIFWIEEAFELPDELVANLENKYFNMQPIVDGIHWGLTAFGLALMFLGITVYFSIQTKEA